jgi:hypothetical protein
MLTIKGRCGSPIAGLAGGAYAARLHRFDHRKAAAAVFFDEGECRVNRARVDRATDVSALLLLLDETGRDETAKVKGKGRRRHAKSRLQFPYRQPVAARLNEQADNLQSGRVSELGEAPRGKIDVHPETYISFDADCNYNPGYIVTNVLVRPQAGNVRIGATD